MIKKLNEDFGSYNPGTLNITDDNGNLVFSMSKGHGFYNIWHNNQDQGVWELSAHSTSFEEIKQRLRETLLFSKGSTGIEGLDNRLKNKGFVVSGPLYSEDISGIVFHNKDNDQIKYYYGGKSVVSLNGGKTKVDFIFFHQLINFLDSHFQDVYTGAGSSGKDDKFSVIYYDDVGPSNDADYIRLNRENESQLNNLGWKYTYDQHTNHYANGSGQKLIFYNLKKHSDYVATGHLLDAGDNVLKTFKQPIGDIIDSLENPSKEPSKNSKLDVLLKPYGFELKNVIGGGEIIVYKGPLNSSIVYNLNAETYIINYTPESATSSKTVQVKNVNDLILFLDKIFPKFITEPSGETYMFDSNAANAKLIKLNDHDEKLLNNCGFKWTPQENQYYKNHMGDIFKFSDIGKAIYYDKSEYNNLEFDNIPKALKFAVAKYIMGVDTSKPAPTTSESPFSDYNYNTTSTPEKPDVIRLNSQDSELINEIGFRWDPNIKRYFKKVISLTEVADFSQKEFYEFIVPHNNGLAVWKSVALNKEGAVTNVLNQKSGKIKDILNYVWEKWKGNKTKKYSQIDFSMVHDVLTKHGFFKLENPQPGILMYANPEKEYAILITKGDSKSSLYTYKNNMLQLFLQGFESLEKLLNYFGESPSGKENVEDKYVISKEQEGFLFGKGFKWLENQHIYVKNYGGPYEEYVQIMGDNNIQYHYKNHKGDSKLFLSFDMNEVINMINITEYNKALLTLYKLGFKEADVLITPNPSATSQLYNSSTHVILQVLDNGQVLHGKLSDGYYSSSPTSFSSLSDAANHFSQLANKPDVKESTYKSMMKAMLK